MSGKLFPPNVQAVKFQESIEMKKRNIVSELLRLTQFHYSKTVEKFRWLKQWNFSQIKIIYTVCKCIFLFIEWSKHFSLCLIWFWSSFVLLRSKDSLRSCKIPMFIRKSTWKFKNLLGIYVHNKINPRLHARESIIIVNEGRREHALIPVQITRLQSTSLTCLLVWIDFSRKTMFNLLWFRFLNK